MHGGRLALACLTLAAVSARDWCRPRYLALNRTQELVFDEGQRNTYNGLDLGRLSREQVSGLQRAFAQQRAQISDPPPRPPPGTRLGVQVCERFLADRTHAFRSFWGIKFTRMFPLCIPLEEERMASWVSEMEAGTACARNWYQGNRGCADQRVVPAYSQTAPAMIGTHQSVSRRCSNRRGVPAMPPYPRHSGDSKRQCIVNHINALALFGSKPRYDMCRNLEWIVCAAKGSLPGQEGSGILTDPPPQHVGVDSLFAVERDGSVPTWFGFNHPHHLEICMLSALCANGAELFRQTTRRQFRCEWIPGALKKLVVQMAGDYYGAGRALIPATNRTCAEGACFKPPPPVLDGQLRPLSPLLGGSSAPAAGSGSHGVGGSGRNATSTLAAMHEVGARPVTDARRYIRT
jgi:hypothetical protein